MVAGQPAGEIRVLPAPTQEKEEDLTNSVVLGFTRTIHTLTRGFRRFAANEKGFSYLSPHPKSK